MATRPAPDYEELSDLDREIDAILEEEEDNDRDSSTDLSLMPAPLMLRKRVDRRLYVDSVADVGAIPVVKAKMPPRTREDSLSPARSPWKQQADQSRSPGNEVRQRYECAEVPPDIPTSTAKQWPYIDPGNSLDWKAPNTKSRYSREQRLAYLRATQTRDSGSSLSPLAEAQMNENDGYALPVGLLHAKFASSNELPHTLEHRPLLPVRSPQRPPAHVSQSVGGASLSRAVMAPFCPERPEDTPALTSRMRKPSARVPQTETFQREQHAFHDNGEGSSLGAFYKETEPVKDRAQTYLNLIDDFVPSSSSSSLSQTRGPPSPSEQPIPLLNHHQGFETLCEEADRSEAKRIKAEQQAHAYALGSQMMGLAGMPFEKVRPAVIQSRLKQGLQQPEGWFGLENADAERQANFGVALDRMYGKIPNEYSANDWLEAERAGVVRGAENGPSRGQSIREATRAGMKKYLGRR